MDEVRIVEPTRSLYHNDRELIRVCAYCRVSTKMDSQLNSYNSQVYYYTESISKKDNWVYAGIYADKGISGRTTLKRKAFNRMMEDAKRGMFDMIICKSISRFARDSVTTLDLSRKLKNMGIGIIFEKENINTLFVSNEMMFSIMSVFAQSESESISKNIRWSVRKRMENGMWIPYYVPFGYMRSDEEIIKNQKEKDTVDFIFKSYSNGQSSQEIANTLNDKKILRRGKRWTDKTVINIIKNPIYRGTLVCQKTYVNQEAPFNRKINDGYLAKFFYDDNHESYINEKLADKIDRIYKFRASQNKALINNQKYRNRNHFSGIVKCGNCKSTMKRRSFIKKGKTCYGYVCIEHINDKENCSMKMIDEKQIKEGFVIMMMRLQSNIRIFRTYLKDLYEISKMKNNEITYYEDYIESLYLNVKKESKLNLESDYCDEMSLRKILEGTKRIEEYKDILRELYIEDDLSIEINNTRELIKLLEYEDVSNKFSEQLFEYFVQEVFVSEDGVLSFILSNGLEFEVKAGVSQWQIN